MKALIVDDEAPVRQLVVTVLTQQGYETAQAESAAEALELAGKNNYDLVVTDVTMPGMSGPELVAELTNRRYPARYLLISGFCQQPSGDVAFLSKPFTPAQLIRAIEDSQKKSPPSRLADLRRDLERARAKWLNAMDELVGITSQLPSGIPQPDGSLLVEQAGRKLSEAYSKFSDVFDKYRNVLKLSSPPPESPGQDDPGPKKCSA